MADRTTVSASDLDRVRAWAREQAERAPGIAPTTARAIAGALRRAAKHPTRAAA